MDQPLKTFICYAHEDRQVVDDLREHLTLYEKKKLLEIWYDGKILAGEKWDDSIKNALKAADLILMLISVKFINSEYIEKEELQEAFTRHRAGEATLIPIIVSSCDWEEYFELGRFQALPNQAVPILSRHFPHKTDAYHEVALGVKQSAQNLLEKKRALLAKAAEEKVRQAHQQEVEAQKAEKARSRRDDAFWEKISAEAEAATNILQKIILYETYLDDLDHMNHLGKAQEAADKYRAEMEASRKLEAAKQKREAEAKKRQKEEEDRIAKETEALKRKQEAAAQKQEEEEKARQKGLPEMVFVRGGTFQMGDKGIATPVHSVTLSDFNIGKYLVTQKLWQEIMGNNPAHFKGDDLPVENVSWNDVQDFLQKLNARFPGKNYRLPTEAEWEFAGRGGTLSKGFQYAGSHDLNEVGWYLGNSGDQPLSGEWKANLLSANNCRTHPVGLKKTNELGICDMSGNVWEWCADWFGDYSVEAQQDPKGPDKGAYRVYRGGSWGSGTRSCRVAGRSGNTPGYGYSSLGFRLASSPQ